MGLAIQDVKERLERDEYAHVYFLHDNLEVDGPTLYDHAFIILKTDQIWRLESYISQYNPRRVTWNDYQTDLIQLIEDPINVWEKIFGVRCVTIPYMGQISVGG